MLKLKIEAAASKNKMQNLTKFWLKLREKTQHAHQKYFKIFEEISQDFFSLFFASKQTLNFRAQFSLFIWCEYHF